MEAAHYRVPLAESLVDAGHGLHTHFELVTCRIVCADGLEGTGYTYTGGSGGSAIRALLADEIAPMLTGLDANDVDAAWALVRTRLHYLGLGGLCGFAVAASDIALWDLRCRRIEQPLWKVAGGADNKVRCYRGLIDLGYPDVQLLARVERECAAGHKGIKIKVGRPDVDRDIRRTLAVRELLGSAGTLMADANYSWDSSRAIAFARGVEGADLCWFEEPVAHDDLAAYAEVAAQTTIALASGENLRTPAEFDQAIAHPAIFYIQPDASNIGGITPWLAIAAKARAAGKPVASHGMHELHVSLMAAQPNAALLEIHSFPIDAYTRTPTRVQDGTTFAPDTPGIGVAFDQDLLSPHRIG